MTWQRKILFDTMFCVNISITSITNHAIQHPHNTHFHNCLLLFD
jgi:hypothetical protein